MRRWQGTPVSEGSRVGRAVHREAVPFTAGPHALPADRRDAELARVAAAYDVARAGIEERRRALDGEVGSIFEVHRLLLDAVEAEITTAVEGGASAEHAAATVLRRYANRLAQSSDPRFVERRQDVLDVERRLLRALAGASGPRPAGEEAEAPVVVVAEDLTPSETAELAGRPVAGLVLEHGGPTSHTAILAKALGFPCVVGLPGVVAAIPPGAEVWVDGERGLVVLEPDAEALRDAHRRAACHAEAERLLLTEKDLPAETIDGHDVALLANVEFPLEVASATRWGAAGIGLYRTEFLYEPGSPVPDEAAHVEVYRAALARVRPGRLTVRTFDFGSDKGAPGGVSPEPNPALGLRSLRWCFDHPEVFRPQLRALLRVAAEGDLRVMLPMVSSVEELRAAKALLRDVADELAKEGVAHRADPPVGIMVEVPGAVLAADLLAAEAAFFSIGTNDLIQYTLAVDRRNERVTPLFRPSHPGVLRLLERTIAAAAAAGIPVSMCGEMGGNPAYAVLLLGLGLREFSLTPIVIPRVRRLVRSLTLARARAVAARCLRLSTSDEVDAYLRAALAETHPAVAVEV